MLHPLRHFLDIPLIGREVPVGDGTVAQIFSEHDIDTAYDVSHHAIAHNNDFFEPAQDIADLFGGKPAHVTAAGHVGGIVTDATAPRHCVEHILSGLAERREGTVQVEGGDVACVSVFVGGKGVDTVGSTIVDIFGRLEGYSWNLGVICSIDQPWRGGILYG